MNLNVASPDVNMSLFGKTCEELSGREGEDLNFIGGNMRVGGGRC